MCSDSVDYVYLTLNDEDDDSLLHAVGIVAGSHVSVTSLRHIDGVHMSTHLVAAPWIKTQHMYNIILLFYLVLLWCSFKFY